MPDRSDLWTMPVPIDIREVDDQPASSKAALLARVRELAPDPSVFDGENGVQPFLWRTTISTSKVDSYFTEMMPSTLRNFAEDAANGVPVLESHLSFYLPIGRSLTGRYTGPQGTGLGKVRADAYMLPGISNGRVNTDDMIAGIRSGIYSDASVGFRGGEVICSECKAPMFGRGVDCPHWPGDVITDEGGANPRTVVGRIENARLGEFSMVYDGATPGAMVDKIYRMVETGAMRADDVGRIRARYGFKPDFVYTITPAAPAEPRTNEQPHAGEPPKGESMGTEDQRNDQAETLSKQLEALDGQSRAALSRAGAPDGSGIDWLADEVVRLRPLADLGNAYRADLIESVITEGIRAKGAEKFAAEQWRAMLAGLTIDQIKLQRDAFADEAAKIFQGGRQTTDGQDPKQDESDDDDGRRGRDRVPDAFYRA